MDGHGARCVGAAQAADEAATSSSSTADVLSAGALIAMDLMIQLSNAKARAVATNKVDSG